jgi:hypothetical protein
VARIRTVKPEFFRHEALQDLERANPGKYPMLVFAGLWTVCDRYGRFEWKSRQLKLDILPFLEFDMDSTLELLASAGQIVSYEVNGKRYGRVPTFEEHQRITGTEAKASGKYPEPTEKQQGVSMVLPPSNEVNELDDGNTKEATGNQQGRLEREREQEKERERKRQKLGTPDSLMQAVATELRISDRWVKVSISEQVRLAMESGDEGHWIAETMIANGRIFRASKDFKFGEWKKFFSTDNWRGSATLEAKEPNVNELREKQRREAVAAGG